MDKNIRAILIDDEQDSLSALKEQIKLYCPEVQILGTYDDPRKGLAAIRQSPPHVIFLDIQMPGMTGLELMEALNSEDLSIILVTAYSQYAIDAIKLSALDYLLKPVDPDELTAAVEKVKKRVATKQIEDPARIPVFGKLLNDAQTQVFSQETIIGLADEKGIYYVKIKDIIRLEALRNYCYFYFADGSNMLVSKNIGLYIDSLQKYNLVQVHRAHVVNLNHVKRFFKINGHYLKMSDGSEVPVSKMFKDNLG
ncbi:MAG: response regulator [Saprospiraceae bacterium]|nr:response regulator [Saprospiraceae bacterium]